MRSKWCFSIDRMASGDINKALGESSRLANAISDVCEVLVENGYRIDSIQFQTSAVVQLIKSGDPVEIKTLNLTQDQRYCRKKVVGEIYNGTKEETVISCIDMVNAAMIKNTSKLKFEGHTSYLLYKCATVYCCKFVSLVSSYKDKIISVAATKGQDTVLKFKCDVYPLPCILNNDPERRFKFDIVKYLKENLISDPGDGVKLYKKW